MNCVMERAAYEALPDRDTLTNEPVDDGWYRSTANPTTVFQARCDRRTGKLLKWEAYWVEFTEK